MNAEILWQPSAERIANARITRFTSELRAKYEQSFPDYWNLWRWSLANKEVFWREVWRFCEGIGELGERVAIDGHKMPGVQWFPDGQLNFAENLLRLPAKALNRVFEGVPVTNAMSDELTAISFWHEDGGLNYTWNELRGHVGAMQRALRSANVRAGDTVASILPNTFEAVVAMLGATSIGATWSSSSPDFGVEGVLDRFSQIAPKVLFAVDGYFYNRQWFSTIDKVKTIAERLPSVERVVIVTQGYDEVDFTSITNGQTWNDFLGPDVAEPVFERFPFNHPLFVVYSSGTTGKPKAIIHGAGGTLLQLVKEHALHGDLQAGDRLLYFTTTGWIMWQWLVAGLSQGATIMLYDGSPFLNRGAMLWDFAQAERCTHFGVSAKYIEGIKKLGVVPRRSHDLSTLRTIYSTGSPLSPESFDYVYQCVKPDVHLASISGGTDIMSCFAIGNPTLPVYRGEMQCRGLGMAVDVWDDDGKSIPAGANEMGELVCSQAFPSMPLGFVNDPDGARYRAAYFERFPGVWTHGDWCQITANDGMLIVGRSDATLNPGGVRIGTAEIYRQVETIDEVVESIAIGQIFNSDTRVVLFVKLREGLALDDDLVARIKHRIKENTTPRHVPAKILQVPDIPRTKSNKIVELAVRDVVHGRNVKNIEALANPEALEYFRNRAELLS